MKLGSALLLYSLAWSQAESALFELWSLTSRQGEDPESRFGLVRA